jgi:hypothetical protein
MSSSLHAKSLTLLAAASLALAIVAAGCGEEPPITEEQDIAETKELFGDDRVADVLKKDLKKVPRSWAEFETLFGVGRACKRTDSKEIYVVEESSTRATGHQEQTDTLLPRAVVTGCNTGEMNPPGEPLYQSYSLMAALFSSPDVPGAASGDPMVFDRVEVMALDRKTGLYNFYVMTPSAYPDKPGILQRIQLRPRRLGLRLHQGPLEIEGVQEEVERPPVQQLPRQHGPAHERDARALDQLDQHAQDAP